VGREKKVTKGMMELWNIGILEYCKNGRMDLLIIGFTGRVRSALCVSREILVKSANLNIQRGW
jgi:hypothetical protein